uniref:Flavin-containing monooxygenase n=1 Tax=Aegilops tauschii TaxID=37682 RepID=N1QPX5_AEGTA
MSGGAQLTQGDKIRQAVAPRLPVTSCRSAWIRPAATGLAAARELRREGHDVTVLEQSGDVGGQWLYDRRPDAADPLGVAAPVKVHSSMYASLRLISPRQSTGFTDFPFCPKSGRDDRRFPGHREVDLYLKDFCDAFGLMDAVRLNTRVLRAAMTPARRWAVRSVDLGVGECDGADEKKLDAYVDEVFDAVVVATGHYSQPRLPSIKGMETWRGRQMHSHSYRVPEPFRGEVVVVVGCGESGKDIAMEIRGVAKEVYLVAGSMEAVTPGLSKVLAKHSANLHLRLEYMDDFGEKYCDFPRVEGWRHELLGSFVRGMMENLETFRDDYQDSDSIHRAMQEWHLSCVQSSPPSCCSYAESQAAVPAQLVSVNQHND